VTSKDEILVFGAIFFQAGSLAQCIMDLGNGNINPLLVEKDVAFRPIDGKCNKCFFQEFFHNPIQCILFIKTNRKYSYNVCSPSQTRTSGLNILWRW